MDPDSRFDAMITPGVPFDLYWDDGNSRFTSVSAAGLVLCATAAEAALLADTTGPVLLGVISNPDV